MMKVCLACWHGLGTEVCIAALFKVPSPMEDLMCWEMDYKFFAEQISINMKAVPSFEAFGRFLETTNAFALWAQAAQMAWLPWPGAASAMLPLSVEPPKLSQKNTEPGM